MLNNSWNYGNVLNQNGEILIGATSGNPTASFITSSAGTLTFTFGPGSIDIEVNPSALLFNPFRVISGGTGRTILTTYGVLVGEGSNAIHAINVGTSGQVLIASTTGDPAFATISSSSGSITFTFGPNSLGVNLEINVLHSFFNPAQVGSGGTGRTVLTIYSVLLGEGSNQIGAVSGTRGQVLIGSTTGNPAFSTLTSSGGTLTFTLGPNALNISLAFSSNSFFNPFQVANGGTGRTVLAARSVLIGEGSNSIQAVSGTNGQVLIASSTGNPAFSRLTSTGGSLTFVFRSNSLNIDLTFSSFSFFNPVQVANGGTGQTILTTRGVLVGEGSNDIRALAAGTSGQVLIASTTGDPKFGTITSSGGSLTFTFGPNSLNINIALSSYTFLNPLRVENGGSGRTIFTTRGVLLGEGSNNVGGSAAGTNGQVLIGANGANPAFARLSSSSGSISFTFGYNSLDIEFLFGSSAFFNPLQVANGGTGKTVLTTYGVLLGEGSNRTNATAAGTSGQLLIASSSGDPKFATLSSSSGTITFTVGPNSLDMRITLVNSFFSPLQIANGGTSRTLFTATGVLLGEGSNSVGSVSPGTNGQVLIGSSSGDPQFALFTSISGGLTFSVGPNSLNLDLTPLAGIPYPILASNGATGQTTLTAYGVLIGEGTNPVHLTTGTNGQILIASSTGDPQFANLTTTGGTIAFTSGYNSLNIDADFSLAPPGVILGATQRTLLTLYGVLIGEGSNSINATAAGTNGQILIASTTGDPQFTNITSTGGTFTFSFGYNTLNIDFIPLSVVFPVPSRGTGESVLTLYGVLIGEGSNPVNVTAAGTDGQLLIAGSGVDPQFSTLTSSAGSIAFTTGPRGLNLETVPGALLRFVNQGCTGETVLTLYGVLIGEGSNPVNVTAAGTDGQLLIAGTGVDPQFSSLTSSAGSIAFTTGPNGLNLETEPGAFVRSVSQGATGQSVLTLYGVLIGEGSNNVNVTAAGTNGQVLIAASTADPQFADLASIGGSLAFSAGYNSLNIDIADGVAVNFGGTGNSVLTLYGVLLGEGSNGADVTAAGTNGQLLVAASNADPAFATISSSGGTFTFTFGYNSLNIEFIASSLFYSSSAGGTGETVFTTYGVLIGEGSNPINATAPGTDGQLLIAASTADPAFATITSSGGTLTFTFGPNGLNIEFLVESQNHPAFAGGTGLTILTTYGVLIGEGSNPINVTDPGTDGQLLIAGSTADPSFSTITSLGSLSFTFGPSSLNMDVAAALDISFGGTSRTVFTLYGVLIGEGSSAINATSAGTNGQVLIASTTGDPKFTTITSSGGTLTFTFGPNGLNVEFIVTAQINSVAGGGTGRTVLTRYGVLLGEGSNQIRTTAPGTNGQVLIASTTGDPKFGRITSSGNTLTFTFGANSLNVDFIPILTIGFGGTSRTVLTTYGVLLGEGSRAVNATPAGTNGQVLIASGTGDPRFSTITSTGGSLTFTFGANSLNVEFIASARIQGVQGGGTGRTVLTTYGVLIGEGSRNVNVTAAGTNGQALIASSSGDPRFFRITSTGNTLSFTFGPNSLNIDVAAPLGTSVGGTNRVLLTTYGVILGEGSRAVNVTAAGTDGQLLLAATNSDPRFASVSSTLGSIGITVGKNSLNLEALYLPQMQSVSTGGTGRTVLTAFGVLIGGGSLAIRTTLVGTNGQVLIASSTGDPKFSRITSTGNTLSFTFGLNSLNIDVAAPLGTSVGGTNRVLLTTYGVILGEGSRAVNVTAAGTDGQLLLAAANSDPRFASVSSTLGSIGIAVGKNSLNLEALYPTQMQSISSGGTGRTVLTAFGVLIGAGSLAIRTTLPGTNGQVLIASSASDPKFSTITSTGNTFTFTFGSNSLNVEVVGLTSFTFLNPWPVHFGGTGRSLLTAFGVLIGEGSNSIFSTVTGTNGQILIGSSNTNPKFATITSSGGSLSFVYAPGALDIDIAPGGLSVNLGGTGQTVLTTFGVLIGEGSNNINVTAAGTNGQALIARSGADPVFSTFTSTGNTLTFIAGSNGLNVDLNLPYIQANLAYLINSVVGVTSSSLVVSVSTSFNYYLVDTTNGTVTLQFPATSTTGRYWIVKDLSGASDVNPITITTSSGTVTFDGQTIFNLINPFGAVQILYNGNAPTHYELF